MTPDDRIRDAFSALSDGLRDDISRRTARAVADVLAEAHALTGRPTEDGVVQKLLSAVMALGVAGSLTDVLDTLSREAAQMLPGSTLIVMRDGTFAPATSDVPLKVDGQLVAVLRIDQTADLEKQRWKPALDVLARFAAQRLEVITAKRSAELVAAQGAGGLNVSGATDTEAARRYARLLVSEIRLYHEAAVLEGRRARDLSSRLAGEIARARSLYNQRVGESHHLSQYFRDELVRTLADGDSTLI